MPKQIEQIKLSLIDADPVQPRKNFDPGRLAELSASIKKHGIMNPLIVEQAKAGRYILVDGERHRASKELGLNEVPAVIRAPQSDTHRLIEQFHLQEQHEGWSVLEKAVAVSELADQMKIGVVEMAKLLSLPQSSISDYVSFSQLLEKKEYQKGEIPMNYAPKIVALRKFAKQQFLAHDKEFTEEMERSLETAIITRIKSGNIKRAVDLTKIHDAIAMDHTSILKFMKNDSTTVDKLFLESNGKVAGHARNVLYAANQLTSRGRSLRALGGTNLIMENKSSAALLKRAYDEIGEILHS